MRESFCSLDQTSVEIILFRPRNWSVFSPKPDEDQKKRSLPKIEVFFPEIK